MPDVRPRRSSRKSGSGHLKTSVGDWVSAPPGPKAFEVSTPPRRHTRTTKTQCLQYASISSHDSGIRARLSKRDAGELHGSPWRANVIDGQCRYATGTRLPFK